MTFEAPLYLLALALAALPAGLYLSRFVRSQRQVFPAAVFLFSRDMTPLKRLRSRQIGVAFLRTGMVAMLALAFAGPFLLTQPEGEDEASTARFVLFIDRSASMTSVSGDKTVLSEALARARELTESFPRARFAVWLCPVGERKGLAFEDAAATLDALDAVEPSYAACHMTASLDALAKRLDVPASVRVYSDFSAPGAEGRQLSGMASERRSGMELIQLPSVPGNLTLAHLRETAAGLTAWVENPSLRTGTVRLTTRCGDWTGTVDVSLASALDEAAVPLPPDRQVEGACQVALPDDVLAVDNTAYFEIASAEKPKVLIVDGSPTGVQEGSPAFFLSAAIKAGSTGYTVLRLGQPEFSYARLGLASVLVLVDPLPMPSYLEEGIADFVRKGGRLWLLAGQNMASWGRANRLFPGASFRACATVEEHPFDVEWIDRDDPLMAALGSAAPQLLRGWVSTRHTAVSLDQPGVDVLARFSDGVPAFARVALGQGRVVLWSAVPERDNGSFALHPLFPIAVSSFMADLAPPARTVRVPPECVAGSRCAVAPPAAGDAGEGRSVYEGATAAGTRRLLADASGRVECAVPGYYYDLRADSRGGSFTCVVPPSERAAVASVLPGRAPAAESPAVTPKGARKVRYGTILLAAAMALLFLELWLVTRRTAT